MAGIYETEDGETRVSLNADGTATWNRVGSLHWTDFKYIVRGNNIYLDVKEAPANAKPDYIYNAANKTLDDGQGNIYYFQEIK